VDYAPGSDTEISSDGAKSDAPSAKKRESKLSADAQSKILTEARDRFAKVQEVDEENRKAAKEDLRFVYERGAQWPEAARRAREANGEACLEFPQLKQFVNQVINDQRQNRPGIRIHPAGSKASKKDAELLQAIIRGIEYDSNAEAAYDTAFQGAVVGGRGYLRVTTDWERPDSFNQKICIKRVADPMTVWLDPDFQEPDGSDRDFAFVTESISRKEFERRWPNATPLSGDFGNADMRWVSGDDEIVVADYYRRVCKERELLALSDGSKVFRDELPEGSKFPTANGIDIEHSRDVKDYAVEWHKIAGGEAILETFDWPGKTIPVICCMGDEIIVDGKRVFQGLIRQAHDAQRMYNFKKSAEAMTLALAPKAPFMAAVEAIEGHENEYKQSNSMPKAYLPWNAFTADGKPIPMPQREAPPPFANGWAASAENDKADLKSVIGMYENSLGLHGQETSGRAIMAREKQGDNSTFHFVDNLSRAIALTGKIILELIPSYYDTMRSVTHVATDDTRSTVEINKPVPGAEDEYENDVRTGEFAVTVEAGPSYNTKRQETADKLTQMVQSYPPLMQLAGDIVVGALDIPDGDEIAERLKLTLPPPIQEHLKAKQEGEQDPAEAMQQQLAQQMQQMQQMQQALQGMQQQLQETMKERDELKKGSDAMIEKAHLDAAAKVEVAKIGAVADLEIEAIRSEVKARVDQANAQTAAMTAPAEPAGPDPMSTMLQSMDAIMQRFDAFTQEFNAPDSTQLEFDPAGNPIAAHGKRHITRFQFDEAGNPIGTVREPRRPQ
jgi:hypothetical protein